MAWGENAPHVPVEDFLAIQIPTVLPASAGLDWIRIVTHPPVATTFVETVNPPAAVAAVTWPTALRAPIDVDVFEPVTENASDVAEVEPALLDAASVNAPLEEPLLIEHPAKYAYPLTTVTLVPEPVQESVPPDGFDSIASVTTDELSVVTTLP